MDRSSIYYRQAQLLVRILPLVFEDNDRMVLKGGTAINLFVRDLPRLSVDIDLAYLGREERDIALNLIVSQLEDISKRIEQRIEGVRVVGSFRDKSDALRLIVHAMGVSIKVELSPVIRGVVYPSVLGIISERAESEFGFVEVPRLSVADLYGGKICAALDRQHPRDLFDVHLLLQNEGLTEEIRKSTIVYILSHSRPMVDLLDPKAKSIQSVYENEFVEMTKEPVSLEELLCVQRELPLLFRSSLTAEEKKFLLSFKNGDPEWGALGLRDIFELPAVRWKLQNLNRMSAAKRQVALTSLKTVLQISS